MCGPFTCMMSSIGTVVTLSKNVLLLVLRYTPSHDPVRTFFIKMWVIPKVMPQIREEFLPLLKCKTWRQKLCNDKISIIRKPRVGMRLYFYNSKLFILKTVVDLNRIDAEWSTLLVGYPKWKVDADSGKFPLAKMLRF